MPARTDEATGYRYYTLGQCATLDMICQLRCVGFTLEQIAEVLERAALHGEASLFHEGQAKGHGGAL